MKMQKKYLSDVQEALRNAEYLQFADLLSGYLIRMEGEKSKTIGIVGIELVGKSTFINMLLGENIIPISVIHSSAEITVRYSDKETIRTSMGEVDKQRLSELIDNEDFVEIETPNSFLKQNSLVIKEFSEALNKQKLNDVVLMSEIYKCDAVIMIMTAEHLLSENECLFVENYVRYVGADRLLLIVNKLSYVAECDIEQVLDYTKKQLDRQFANVRWTVCDNLDENIGKKYDCKDIMQELIKLTESRDYSDYENIKNMLSYIREQLQKDLETMNIEKAKEIEKVKIENSKIEDEKELKKALVEEKKIEFKNKKYEAIEKIDNYIKEQFEIILLDLINRFERTTNKCIWYEQELKTCWEEAVLSSSERIGNYIYEIVDKDIIWLNNCLETKFDFNEIAKDLSGQTISRDKKMIPYEKYKKYIPIGTGGVVIIGYYIFHIVGAAIGLGSGLLAYSYIKMKDDIQTGEVKKELKSKIRDFSIEARRNIKRDIELIYDNLACEFAQIEKQIIDSEYKFKDIKKYEHEDKMNKIQKVIKYMEEV